MSHQRPQLRNLGDFSCGFHKRTLFHQQNLGFSGSEILIREVQMHAVIDFSLDKPDIETGRLLRMVLRHIDLAVNLTLHFSG